MYSGKTISLGRILWNVMQNKLVTDLSYDDAAAYAIRALRLIGAPLVFENKVTRPPIKVVQHKAALPEDIIEIRGIKLLANTEDNYYDVALRGSTDLYHQDNNCKDDPNCYGSEYTYEIQNNVITTDFKEGELIISYKGLSLDKDGYPNIPDNEKVKMAVEYFILDSYLFNLWSVGKVTDKVYSKIEQLRDWYMGAANADMQMPTIDRLESTMNSINRIFQDNKRHEQFFERMGEKERIRKFN